MTSVSHNTAIVKSHGLLVYQLVQTNKNETSKVRLPARGEGDAESPYVLSYINVINIHTAGEPIAYNLHDLRIQVGSTGCNVRLGHKQ